MPALNQKPARNDLYQGVHAIQYESAFNTPQIGSGKGIWAGTIPANSIVLGGGVVIKEVYNAASTNVLIVGTDTNDDEYVDAGDVDETALGFTEMTTGKGFITTKDTPVYVKYTQSGTAASTGKSRVVVLYAPFNE